nr:radical SAM protein [uncultured Cellulosilyticum sp.]
MRQVSNKLSICKHGDYYYVYHKLFGNLSKFDEKCIKMLNNFSKYEEKYPEIIKRLSDNYFIVEDDEEDEVVREEREDRKLANDGRNLIGLQLIVSNYCNFNCKYCFLDEEHKLRDNSIYNAPSNMKLEVAQKSIDRMINNIKINGNSVLSIEFFGGEPLMNWPLIKGVFDLYRNGEENGIEINYTITTNGSLITEEMAEYFSKYGVNVIISYDSPNSRERITKNGEDLTSILRPVLQILKRKNILVSFNSVISKWTIGNYDYKGLVEFSLENGVRNLGLILDLDAEFLTDTWTEDDIVTLLLNTYDYGRLKGLNVTGYWEKMYQQIANKDYTYFEKGYKACPATGCKVSVEPSGDIFACKCCTYKIGSLEDWDSLLKGERYTQYLNKVYMNGEKCSTCELHAFCSGVCVGALEKKGSMYGINESLCYIYKKVTQELIMRSQDSDFDSIFIMNEQMEE